MPVPEDLTALTQVKMLHAVGTMYCEDEQLALSGAKLRHEISEYCESDREKSSVLDSVPETVYDRSWFTWLDFEMKNRTRYCVWVNMTL